MSVRRNVVANVAGQLYAALIGILLVPLYVRYMGLEAYGLVGFFASLQGWFMLLDLGLTPALSREAARLNGGAIDGLALRRLLRALEGAFIALGGTALLVLAAAAGLAADHWLQAEQLDREEIRRALWLMVVVVVLRWAAGLYRGALTGLEQIVWLNAFGSAIATARFVLVIPFLAFVGATPTHFFGFQLAVALVELPWLAFKTYRLLPPAGAPIRWAWQPLRQVARFSLTAAFTGAVWVLVTQTDKLLVSGLVPLTEYGYFTLSVLVASGILLVSNPVSGAVLPRLTRLAAAGDEAGFVRLYRDATQLVAVIAVPIVLVLAFFPAQVLNAWTGSADIAANASRILALYAIGNGLLTVAAFPYYLQVARGNLDLHLVGNVLFVLIFIPLLLLAVARFGVVGAAYAWIAANLVPFVAWLPVVHARWLKGLHLSWLTADVALVAALPTLAGALLAHVVEWPSDRVALAAALLLLYGTLAVLAAGSSSAVRRRLAVRLNRSTR